MRCFAHGSCALVKEVNDTCLKDLVADSKHMIAIRNIKWASSRNKRCQLPGTACHLILGPHADQHWYANAGHPIGAQGLTRAADTGGQRVQV